MNFDNVIWRNDYVRNEVADDAIHAIVCDVGCERSRHATAS